MARYLVLGDPVVALGPHLPPLYQRWYDVPVEPAHTYNARRVTGAD